MASAEIYWKENVRWNSWKNEKKRNILVEDEVWFETLIEIFFCWFNNFFEFNQPWTINL